MPERTTTIERKTALASPPALVFAVVTSSKLRQTAAELDLDVTVHHAAIEEMDLATTYRTIFLAGPTFNLIVDDATAVRALERIRRHLDPAGAALVALFLPEAVPERHLGLPANTSTSGAESRA